MDNLPIDSEFMRTVSPEDVSVAQFHGYLLGAVAPRPIAFASTVDKEGNVNLSPFSFYNAFGAKPATLVFSPSRRVRDGSTKHTLENVLEVPEVVINAVTYDIVEQMSLSSTEYERGVNEFVKAGLTELPSEKVRPPRVAESPVQFECKVKDVIHLGEEGGAGNLIVCEVLLAHISEDVLDDDDKIDVETLGLVGRMGGNYYVKAFGDALFEVEKPIRKKGIGIDGLPTYIRQSNVLTGNDLAKLANVEKVPEAEELENLRLIENIQITQENQHEVAGLLLEEGRVMEAWKVLLMWRQEGRVVPM